MKTFDELVELIHSWAHERGLSRRQHAEKQMLKVVEEIGELSAGLARKDKEAITDAIGDVLVTIIILSNQLGIDPVKSLNEVYDVISKRTGKTVNGVFIKDGDQK